MKSVRRSGNQRVHLDTSILKEKAISHYREIALIKKMRDA